MEHELLGEADDLGVTRPPGGRDQRAEGADRGLVFGHAAAALHVRALVGRLARIFQVALLLEDAGREGSPDWLAAAAELLLTRYVVRGYEPAADAGYGELLERLLAT
jgi:hypothetical protein